jgi:hypothetical protein
MRDDVLQVFQYADRERAVDRRKVVEELGERPIVFEVVQQRADRNTGSDEDWRSAQ